MTALQRAVIAVGAANHRETDAFPRANAPLYGVTVGSLADLRAYAASRLSVTLLRPSDFDA